MGVLLAVAGYGAAHELGAKVHYLFTGRIPDQARNLLVAGGVVALFGVFQIYTARK